MRRFERGIGVRPPGWSRLRRAALVLLTAVGVIMTSASADPVWANRKYAAIVVNGNTGEVLFSRKADYRRYPASLTKVMTLYLTFEALEGEKLKLADNIPVSRRCAGMPPSKLGMKAGDKITVQKAIDALIVRSANDVACAVGEKLGGTEFKFALEMTKKARAIGMSRTKFRNASGLYNRSQVTTARDMATLALRIQKDFPQYYPNFKHLKVSWKGRTWNTHNRLMKSFQGADGLKTGYVRASGFNLITSAHRGNMHLVGVVMGGRRSRSRDRHMANLLERYFALLLKRPDYSYPVADRLPEVRPKPDFAAIDSKKWIRKQVGVLPRPNPFQPGEPPSAETGEVAIAELKKEPPGPISGGGAGIPDAGTDAGGAAETDSGGKAAKPAAAAVTEPASGKDGKNADDTKTDSNDGGREGAHPPLPVLADSGSGTLPAGAGTAVDGKTADAPPQTESSAPEMQIAAAPRPDSSDGDTLAQLIEEGDGQVATDDLDGQLPATADEEGDGGVRVASAVPAAGQTSAAVPARRLQWGVQLGAFTTVELAEMHLDNAERLHPEVLTREKSALVPKQDGSGELYRARFGPMDETLARAACEKLRAGGMRCFALELDDWDQAVRR